MAGKPGEGVGQPQVAVSMAAEGTVVGHGILRGELSQRGCRFRGDSCCHSLSGGDLTFSFRDGSGKCMMRLASVVEGVPGGGNCGRGRGQVSSWRSPCRRRVRLWLGPERGDGESGVRLIGRKDGGTKLCQILFRGEGC